MLQIVADICNIELSVPEQQIGASYGDAFLAATGIGLFSNLSEVKRWVKTKETIKPRGQGNGAYEMNYRIFRELYGRTKELMHVITDRERLEG